MQNGDKMVEDIKAFLKAMFTKGNWKNSGKTNKDISNFQRILIALCQMIGGSVTLLTLGRITSWADIGMGMNFYARRKKGEEMPVAEIEDLNAVNDIVADKDNGACPDDECSGGITDGICSHCEDEWAWKQHENSLEEST